MAAPSTDYIYWTFSAASQSIAAFVALLLTGYALVHALMESARDRDDTLDEIHAELRAAYHRHLRTLAWLTGASVVLSLVLVYVNRPGEPPPALAVSAVALMDLSAVIFGLGFVVSIVNPAKYRKAAEKVLEHHGTPVGAPLQSAASEFFDTFLHLERLVRDFLRARDLYVPSRGAPRMSYSFRQMIEALRQNEVIDSALFKELLELNRYRNLVFHGHLEQADPDMVSRARNAAAQFESISANA